MDVMRGERLGTSRARREVGGVAVPFVAFEGEPGAYLMVPTGPAGTGISVGR